MGALLVGATFGRSMAWALGTKAIGVHHMEAHLLAPLLNQNQVPPLPFLALLVSGGHTQLVKVDRIGATNCWANHSTTRPARLLIKPRK